MVVTIILINMSGNWVASKLDWLLMAYALASASLLFAVSPRPVGAKLISPPRSLRATLATAVPATLILVAISGPIVDALFVRDALGAREGALIAEIQTYYLLQLPFYLLGLIGVRMLSALGRNRDIALIASLNFFANIALNLLFMRWLGVAGIALATSVVYAISTALIFLALRHRMPAGEPPPVRPEPP